MTSGCFVLPGQESNCLSTSWFKAKRALRADQPGVDVKLSRGRFGSTACRRRFAPVTPSVSIESAYRALALRDQLTIHERPPASRLDVIRCQGSLSDI